MDGHGVCHRLPTDFYFHLVKGTWLVELVWFTNSKDEMVQNSGTKPSHMSWSREARTWDKQHLAADLELCSCLVQVHMFRLSVDKKSMSVFLLLLSLTVNTPKHP